MEISVVENGQTVVYVFTDAEVKEIVKEITRTKNAGARANQKLLYNNNVVKCSTCDKDIKKYYIKKHQASFCKSEKSNEAAPVSKETGDTATATRFALK